MKKCSRDERMERKEKKRNGVTGSLLRKRETIRVEEKIFGRREI